MRSFLPIKGPGGRHLTPNEKVALLVLGLTLVFCLLTILAGESAFDPEASRNPVFAIVAALCRWMGGGIVALYALVVVWSGLIYFKGERIAQVAPITGRLVAAFAVMVGVSGALGAASLQTAGALGDTVSAALQRTFGPTAAFPILFGLMILGLHLAGRGAWSALREPTPAPEGGGAGMLGFVKTPTPSKTPGGYGIGVQVPLGRRGTSEPMPDDGDPSAEERSVFVARAVADIERRQGVTILEVSEPGADGDADEDDAGEDEPGQEVDGMAAEEQADGAGPVARASIGEEVDSAPRPAAGSDEEDVQRRLRAIDAALAGSPAAPPVDDEADADTEEASDAAVAGRPVRDDDEEEAADDDEYEDEAYEDDDEDAEYAEDEYDDDRYDEEEEAYDEEEDDEEGEEEEDEEERYGYDDDEEDAADENGHGFVPVPADDEEAPEPVTPRSPTADGPVQAEFALPEAPEAEVEEPEVEEPGVEEPGVEEPGAEEPPADEAPEEPARRAGEDPYARPGLLDRLRSADPDDARGVGDRPYTTFDWRGRPVE